MTIVLKRFLKGVKCEAQAQWVDKAIHICSKSEGKLNCSDDGYLLATTLGKGPLCLQLQGNRLLGSTAGRSHVLLGRFTCLCGVQSCRNMEAPKQGTCRKILDQQEASTAQQDHHSDAEQALPQDELAGPLLVFCCLPLLEFCAYFQSAQGKSKYLLGLH